MPKKASRFCQDLNISIMYTWHSQLYLFPQSNIFLFSAKKVKQKLKRNMVDVLHTNNTSICVSLSKGLLCLVLSRVQLFVSFIVHGLQPASSSVYGNLQARILEWVAISFPMGSSRTRGQSQVSHFAGRFFTEWASRVFKAFLTL